MWRFGGRRILEVLRLRGKAAEKPSPDTQATGLERSPPPPTPHQHLHQLTLSLIPHHPPHLWETARLDDAIIKAKILLSCEQAFHKSFPDAKLGQMVTVADVLRFLDSPPTKLPSLFPSLPPTGLPPNLSLQTHMPQRVEAKGRTPFQNFHDKKHAKFPNKKFKGSRSNVRGQ